MLAVSQTTRTFATRFPAGPYHVVPANAGTHTALSYR